MPIYEYKVVPAPTKGLKAKGIKTPEARFSHAIEDLMNRMAGDGWEYQRAETLPSVERSGLASTTTEWRNVLVFRRLRENDADAFAPELLPAPEPAAIPAVTAASGSDAAQGGDSAETGEKAGKEAADPAPATVTDVDASETQEDTTITNIEDARNREKSDV